MAGFVKDLKKILRDNGCEFVRNGKGSYEIGLVQSLELILPFLTVLNPNTPV